MINTQRSRVTTIAVVLTVISFLTAYFIKPHPPTQEIVPAPASIVGTTKNPNVPPLSVRIQKSFALALILVRSDFTLPNAAALEALRNWASKNFEQDANFLHPPSVDNETEASQSIIDSYAYSLLGTTRYFFESLMSDFLKNRIQDYQTSPSYLSMCVDYFGLFGYDLDSAQLLARYQSERAKDAVDPMLIGLLWLLLGAAAISYWMFGKPSTPFSRTQVVLAYGWLTLAVFYTVSAWVQNQISILISAVICCLIGLYLRRPIKAVFGENRALSFELVSLSSTVLSLLTWVSISLLLIRIVSWINTGSLLHPDPITLFISGLRGDFFHDPVHVKRNMERIAALSWLAYTMWLLPRLSGEWTEDAAQDEPLRAIQKPLY